jgi:hypothetical protein
VPAREDTSCHTFVAPAPATRSPRRGVTFKQADVQRALRAAMRAGLTVTQVELDLATGKITIRTSATEGTQTLTPLDIWQATRARTS